MVFLPSYIEGERQIYMLKVVNLPLIDKTLVCEPRLITVRFHYQIGHKRIFMLPKLRKNICTRPFEVRDSLKVSVYPK